MLRSYVLTLACLAGLAGPAAHATDEPRLEPGLYVEIPFGGARAAAPGPQLSARLDYHHARLAAAPAVLEWRLDGQRSAVAFMGLPLAAGLGYRVDANGDSGGTVARAVGISAGATLLVGGLAAWALSAALESFGDDVGTAVAENMFGPGEEGGGDDTGTPSEPCTGVQVGDECVTTSGGGG